MQGIEFPLGRFTVFFALSSLCDLARDIGRRPLWEYDGADLIEVISAILDDWVGDPAQAVGAVLFADEVDAFDELHRLAFDGKKLYAPWPELETYLHSDEAVAFLRQASVCSFRMMCNGLPPLKASERAE